MKVIEGILESKSQRVDDKLLAKLAERIRKETRLKDLKVMLLFVEKTNSRRKRKILRMTLF